MLEPFRIFNDCSSLSKLWNTKVLEKNTKFNGAYSRNNWPKLKDGVNGINLDEYVNDNMYVNMVII